MPVLKFTKQYSKFIILFLSIKRLDQNSLNTDFQSKAFKDGGLQN